MFLEMWPVHHAFVRGLARDGRVPTNQENGWPVPEHPSCSSTRHRLNRELSLSDRKGVFPGFERDGAPRFCSIRRTLEFKVTLPAEGWYPDPSGPPWVNRWWSGTEWTDRTQMMPPPPSSQSASGGPQLAGYGLRLGAWLLDFVFVSVISVPLLIPFGGVFHRTNSQLVNGNGTFTNHSVTYGIHGVGLLVQAALVLLYGMFFVGSRRAQTPGMMIAGIRCMRSDRNVVRVGHGKALLHRVRGVPPCCCTLHPLGH